MIGREMPYASEKPKMAKRWDKEKTMYGKKKMASDINLKENIEDASDDVDKMVRGGVLEDLIKQMGDGELKPVMITIETSTMTPKETPEEMEEEEDEELENLLKSKMT